MVQGMVSAGMDHQWLLLWKVGAGLKELDKHSGGKVKQKEVDFLFGRGYGGYMEFLKKMNPVFVSVIAFCALFGLTLSLFLNPIKEDIGQLERDIHKLERDIHRLEGNIQQVRTDLGADIDEVHTELKADINEVRTELKADISEVRREFNTHMNRIEGKLDLLIMGKKPARKLAGQSS